MQVVPVGPAALSFSVTVSRLAVSASCIAAEGVPLRAVNAASVARHAVSLVATSFFGGVGLPRFFPRLRLQNRVLLLHLLHGSNHSPSLPLGVLLQRGDCSSCPLIFSQMTFAQRHHCLPCSQSFSLCSRKRGLCCSPCRFLGQQFSSSWWWPSSSLHAPSPPKIDCSPAFATLLQPLPLSPSPLPLQPQLRRVLLPTLLPLTP